MHTFCVICGTKTAEGGWFCHECGRSSTTETDQPAAVDSSEYATPGDPDWDSTAIRSTTS